MCGKGVVRAHTRRSSQEKCKTVVKKKDQTHYRHGICEKARRRQWFPIAPAFQKIITSASDTWGTQQSCVSEDAVPWPCRHMSVTFAAMATHIWTLGCKTVAPSPGLFYGARTDSQSPLKPVYLSGSFRGCYPPIHVGLVLSQSSLIFPFLSSSHIWGLDYLFLLENSHWLGWQLSHCLKTLFS